VPLLVTSPWLQDLALDSILSLLEQIAISKAVAFHELLGMLRARFDQAGSSKHAIYNLAKCVAVITSVTSPKNLQGVVLETLQSLEDSTTPQEDPALLKQV
jgi:hypothetical protein